MFHTIIIVGNVGRDPEMRYTPSGQAVTSFSVATSRNYNSQGQNHLVPCFLLGTSGRNCQQLCQERSEGPGRRTSGRRSQRQSPHLYPSGRYTRCLFRNQRHQPQNAEQPFRKRRRIQQQLQSEQQHFFRHCLYGQRHGSWRKLRHGS